MNGFEKLKDLKDNMMRPVYEKRRHLGCEFCGTTFYGYYQKQGAHPVPNGETSPHSSKEGWLEVHTYEDVFFPDCPDCYHSLGICDAKTAKEIYVDRKERSRKAEERRKARQAKYDAEPVKINKKLTYANRQTYYDRIDYLADNPDDMNKYELMSSWLLDKVFWKKFGKGCHTMQSRHFTITKHLYDGTYMSNSGKTRRGSYTPYFEVTNNQTGKVREVGIERVRFKIELRRKYGTNRRNDPDRGYGLPNSRGYR